MFKQSKGTIFHINCLTGKDISLYSVYNTEKEVLLLPFTYLMVEKIQRFDNYDEVWLSEMPTPNTFKQDFIIWVDDIPTNNTQYIPNILKRGLEVIQLTSTEMAKKWTSEYGWLLNWMDVKFRVVSDMVRI